MPTPKKNLPTVHECMAYVISLGYACIERGRGYYVFRDVTGQRPLHNKEMTWNLTQMREAVLYGC